jgi:hypothetical protein
LHSVVKERRAALQIFKGQLVLTVRANPLPPSRLPAKPSIQMAAQIVRDMSQRYDGLRLDVVSELCAQRMDLPRLISECSAFLQRRCVHASKVCDLEGSADRLHYTVTPDHWLVQLGKLSTKKLAAKCECAVCTDQDGVHHSDWYEFVFLPAVNTRSTLSDLASHTASGSGSGIDVNDVKRRVFEPETDHHDNRLVRGKDHGRDSLTEGDVRCGSVPWLLHSMFSVLNITRARMAACGSGSTLAGGLSAGFAVTAREQRVGLIDVGCSTGHLLLHAGLRYANLDVLGVEIDVGRAAKAQALFHAAAAMLHDQVKLPDEQAAAHGSVADTAILCSDFLEVKQPLLWPPISVVWANNEVRSAPPVCVCTDLCYGIHHVSSLSCFSEMGPQS